MAHVKSGFGSCGSLGFHCEDPQLTVSGGARRANSSGCLDWELTLISFDHAVGERAAKVCKKRMRTPVEVRERIGYSPMGSVEARDCLMRALRQADSFFS